jgi:medium-chain acyl-[acyl-carrier-protein] hydrolase
VSRPVPVAPAPLVPWVQFTAPVPATHLPLICFHHAGGSASFFRGWIPKLADRGIDVWPVQLPGRENRYHEPVVTDLAALTATLTRFLAGHLADRPFALYGHSAGAWMACAFAMRLADIGMAPPRHIFVAASRPPSHPDPDTPIHLMPPLPLLAKLRSYGGIHPDILASPEVVEMVLTTARADLGLVERASWPTSAWLDCPVTAVGGAEDRNVPTELLPDWRAITRGTFDHAVVPGGHFPTPAAEARLLALLSAALDEHRPSGRPA